MPQLRVVYGCGGVVAGLLHRCALLFSCLAAYVFARSMRAGARSHSWSCAATAAQALPAAPSGMFKLAVHCALCAPWSSVCVRSLAVLFGVCAHLAHGAFVLCRCAGRVRRGSFGSIACVWFSAFSGSVFARVDAVLWRFAVCLFVVLRSRSRWLGACRALCASLGFFAAACYACF